MGSPEILKALLKHLKFVEKHFALPSVPAGPCAEQDISQCYSGEESTDIASDVEDDSDISSDDANVVEIDSDPPDLESDADEEEMDKVMMCGPC